MSGLIWTRGTACACARRPPIGTFQGSGPHDELFFFTLKKEQVNDVSAETLDACAAIGLHPRQTTKWDREVASLLTEETSRKPDLEQPVFGKCHLW